MANRRWLLCWGIKGIILKQLKPYHAIKNFFLKGLKYSNRTVKNIHWYSNKAVKSSMVWNTVTKWCSTSEHLIPNKVCHYDVIILSDFIKPTYHPKQFSDTSPMPAAAQLATQSVSISMYMNFSQNSTQESLQYNIKQSSSVDDTQLTLLITPENRHREKLLQSKTCNTSHL